MDDLVSIIMPSYNTANFIAESINSVLNQTYINWELIIVDDCSSDNTDEIVASFTDSRIKYSKNEKNCGAAVTRNAALRQAKGKYIAFLDSDDLWDSVKLEKMISFMNANKIDFAYHEYRKIDEKNQALGISVSGPRIISKWKMYQYDYIGCLTFMYNSEVFGLIQIEDIKKNNDYAMLLQLCKKCVCYLLPEELASYRIRTRSISHDKLSKKIKSHYELFRLCDKKSRIISLILAYRNLFFGMLKKVIYEKKVVSNESK